MIKFIDKNEVKLAHFSILDVEYGGLTPVTWALQALKPKLNNQLVERHIHLDRLENPELSRTSECCICSRRRCSFTVYDLNKQSEYSSNLLESQVLIVETGGNSISDATDDFLFLELKLGPFLKMNWEYF